MCLFYREVTNRRTCLPRPNNEVYVFLHITNTNDAVLYKFPWRITPLVAIDTGMADISAITRQLVRPIGEIPMEVSYMPKITCNI